MTTPPGYNGAETDTEGVTGNTGSAPLGTQRVASNTDTTGPAGAGYGGGPTGQTPDPNTQVTGGTVDTSGFDTGSVATAYVPDVNPLISGTIDTRGVNWPPTPGVVQAYRAPNTTVGYLDGTGSRDTTWTDRPISDGNGATRVDLQTNYTGTLDSYYIGAPAGPVGTGIPGTPSAPTAVSGPRTAIVSWSAVADPSNAPVTGYVILGSTGGTTYAARNATSVTVQNLVPDQSYTFKVAARNINGIGPYSSASSAVTPYNPDEADVNKPGGFDAYSAQNPIYNPDGTVKVGSGTLGTPGAPTGVTLTQGAAGVLNVSWTAPTTGGKVVSYTVTLSTGQTKSVSSTTLSTSFSGLTTGTSTTARVTAVGTVFSTQSAASSAVNVP
jgi:hypothetical protein